MRIAVHQTTPIAGRAASVLLADRRLDLLGVVDGDPHGDKLARADDLGEWDVVLSDTETPGEILSRAVEAHVPLVLSASSEENPPITLFQDASLAGVAVALASTLDMTRIAATTRGTPLRRGIRVDFPPPVGSLTAASRTDGVLVAPTDTDWGGLLVEAESDSYGLADHQDFLAGIALAAAALVVATAPHPPGRVDPVTVAERYLNAAEEAGMEIARFRRPRQTRR
jgi:hypothetical protein